jgi:outer membrane receptor protein involved in Fe transport
LFPIYGAPATGGDSAKINEVQYEKNVYGVLAWQHTTGDLDMQLAYFSRYNSLLFVPDVYGDILFNGIASNVYRSSFMNGVQGDNAYRINDVHTVRFGFNSSVEQGIVRTVATVEPCCDPSGNATGGPFSFTDPSIKTGYLAGVYLQDEWRLTPQLTLNWGARFDEMWQYVDKYQLSPRANFVYKPFWGTTIHAGYARYFTPPLLTLEAQANTELYRNTPAHRRCLRRADSSRALQRGRCGHHPAAVAAVPDGNKRPLWQGTDRRRAGAQLPEPRGRDGRLLQAGPGPPR